MEKVFPFPKRVSFEYLHGPVSAQQYLLSQTFSVSQALPENEGLRNCSQEKAGTVEAQWEESKIIPDGGRLFPPAALPRPSVEALTLNQVLMISWDRTLYGFVNLL